ncbi:MAG: GlmU family protein [Chitinophagales bacterium]
MALILFDGKEREQLLPLTYTRPVAELRIGILKISEKWEQHLDQKASFFTQPYLSEKFPIDASDKCLLVNGSVCPDEKLVETIDNLDRGVWLIKEEQKIALKLNREDLPASLEDLLGLELKTQNYEAEIFAINHLWDIFNKNNIALESDFELLTKGRSSESIPASNQIVGDRIFLEKGAKVNFTTLNSTNGPIYIGEKAEIMEGAMIRGGLALCESAVLKMGAKIYGASTFGPHCKIGGEVNNSVFQGFSNKAHDGFLGNSVIGEWCNLGADTNNSNLKNDYGPVKIWNYPKRSFANTGLQFCGLMMGDHSKCSINTMFNTGTVVGVFANIFGSGFPRNFVPSFSWGGSRGMIEYNLDKAFKVAETVMSRRDKVLDEKEKAILSYIFEVTKTFRAK